MFWEIYQTSMIHQAQGTALRAEGKAGRMQVHNDNLESKIESLALICQSMWELMSESMPDAQNRLAAKIEEVDLRDGKKDGKISRVETHCPSCSRALHKRHRRCMYCGEQLQAESIFQK